MSAVTVEDWEHECSPVPVGVRVYRSRMAGNLVAGCDRCGWLCGYWECACDLTHDCAVRP